MPSRVVITTLVVLAVVALFAMACRMSKANEEHFGNEGEDSATNEYAEAMVFRVYMDIYGVPPPTSVSKRYSAMVSESATDEHTLKSMLEADMDAAPVASEFDETADATSPMYDVDQEGLEHYSAGSGFTNSMIEFGPGSRVADCSGGVCKKGTNVQIWDSHGGANQQWTYDPKKQTVMAQGKCLDVKSSGKADGTNVQAYDCNGGAAQKWVVQNNKGPGQGAVQLMNPNSGKCLDVAGAVDKQGQNVQIWDCAKSGHSWDIREPGVAASATSTGWTQINGQAVQVALTRDWAMVVNAADEIFIAKSGTGDWHIKDGRLKHVSISSTKMCGVNKENKIFWASTPNSVAGKSLGWQHKGGVLVQTCISDDGLWGGVNDAGALFIAPAGSSDWKQMPGSGKYMTLSGKRACVVGSSGKIYCADDVNRTNWIEMGPQTFKTVELSGDNLVAVDDKGDVYFGKYKTGGWQKIGYGCKHAAITGNLIYAIDKSNNIFKFTVSASTVAVATAQLSPQSAPAGTIPQNVSLVSGTATDKTTLGSFSLVMQTDGNLVLYGAGNKPLWASSTAGKGKAPYRATMQNDGNFVVYDSVNTPLWHSKTYGKGTAPYTAKVQSDGNFVVYDGKGSPLWASQTQVAQVVKPQEGQALFCAKSSPNGQTGTVWRYDGGKLRAYPNREVAVSWMPEFNDAVKAKLPQLDCSGLSSGANMEMKPQEGQSVKCAGTPGPKGSGAVYRYEGGKLRHYPDPAIASSWDSKWGQAVGIDCTGATLGPNMAMKGAAAAAPSAATVVATQTQVAPAKPQEGQALFCEKSSPNGQTGTVWRYDGGKLRAYPNREVAVSWMPEFNDAVKAKLPKMDCAGLPSGANMEMKPQEGQSVKCAGTPGPKGSGAVYRYEGGKLRHYPDPAIASSWDTKWGQAVGIDCTGASLGPNMAMKGATTAPVSTVVTTPAAAAAPASTVVTNPAAAATSAPTIVTTSAAGPVDTAVSLAEGQAVQCTKNSPIAGGIFRFENGKLRHYPNREIALTWMPGFNDAVKAQVPGVDCAGFPLGPAMTPNTDVSVAGPVDVVIQPAEGQAVKCSTGSPVAGAGAVFRYEGGKLRHYPSPPIADSWDKDWGKATNIDCTGVPVGPPMGMKPAVTVVVDAKDDGRASAENIAAAISAITGDPVSQKAVEKTIREASSGSSTTSGSRKSRKQTCSCNVNVSPTLNANRTSGHRHVCSHCNRPIASPRTALRLLEEKAWELRGSPSMVVPARTDQGAIGLRLQTLADQVASLSTEYNGLPSGGLAPMGFENYINFS